MNLVSFKVQVVDKVLDVSDERTVFLHPVLLVLLGQFYDFRTYPVEKFCVFFFAHQSAGIAQHMWEYGEIPTETNLFHLRTGADLVSVEVGFCLAGDAQQVGQFVGVCRGILRRKQIAVQREFAEEGSHASRNADHGNEWSEKHGLHAQRGVGRAVYSQRIADLVVSAYAFPADQRLVNGGDVRIRSI